MVKRQLWSYVGSVYLPWSHSGANCSFLLLAVFAPWSIPTTDVDDFLGEIFRNFSVMHSLFFFQHHQWLGPLMLGLHLALSIYVVGGTCSALSPKFMSLHIKIQEPWSSLSHVWGQWRPGMEWWVASIFFPGTIEQVPSCHAPVNSSSKHYSQKHIDEK